MLGHCLAPSEIIQQTVDSALEKDDDTSLTYLDGSYTTIIDRGHTATILSDIAGQFPVYYAQNEQQAWVSTSSDMVAEYTGGLPSRHGLAMYLLGEVSPLGWCTTAYQGVSRLPGAHRLELNAHGIHAFPYDVLAPDRTFSKEDAVQKVRESLVGAVAARIACYNTVSSDFSGGYDSTSLAFLAAAQLPSDARLEVFHGRYNDSTLSGDAQYANAFTAFDTRLRLHTTSLPAKSELTPQGAIEEALYRRISAELKDKVHTAHITGIGGDALFHTSGLHILDMWRNKKLHEMPRFVRDMLAQATLTHTDPLKIFGRVRQMSKITYDESLQAIGEGLSQGVHYNPWLMIDGSSLALLSNDAHKKVREVMDERRKVMPAPAVGIADYRAIADIQTSGIIAAHARRQALQHGINLHAPYLDHAVIRACLTLPATDRYDTYQFKTLLADALRFDVPAAVFQRNTKGDAIGEIYQDVRNHADELRETLGPTSYLARLGVIDVAAVQTGVTKAELGLRSAPTSFIAKAVALERWLQNSYDLPPKPIRKAVVSTYEKPAARLPTLLPKAVFVPPHVRLVRDMGGLVFYNLKTKALRSMHADVANIVELLDHGIPDTELAQAAIANLLAEDFLQPGPNQPVTINHTLNSAIQTHESKAHLGRIDTTGVRPSDYARMAPALFKAVKLVKHHSLWELTQIATESKRNLPPANPEHVRRLMTAGHVLGQFYLARTACQELSLAAVLAEAKAGSAVDWCIGTAPDPRRIHSWPQINGQPIQTPQDEVAVENFTPFGVW